MREELELTYDELWAFAKLMKNITLYDLMVSSKDEAEFVLMHNALFKVRIFMLNMGFYPSD